MHSVFNTMLCHDVYKKTCYVINCNQWSRACLYSVNMLKEAILRMLGKNKKKRESNHKPASMTIEYQCRADLNF